MASSDSQVLNYPISQINGCRRFGPKLEMKNLNPPRGSEIFVARIPQTFSHQELLSIFLRAGEVYDVRLMLDFSKKCKGFAFVRFMKPGIALKAISFINRCRIYHEGSSSRLVAMVSTDHRTLVLTGCPSDISRQEVEEYFKEIAEDGGLENVTVEYQLGLAAPVFNLLFATHRAAALMKKSDWIEGIPRRWGKWVRLYWQPNEEVDQRMRFKQERRHFLSLMGNSFREDNGAIVPTYGFNPLSFASAEMSVMGRSALSATSTSVLPPAGMSLSATSASVRPLSATNDNAVGSGLNVFAPTFKLNEGQRQEAHLLSPQQFLSPRSSSNIAQFEGFSEASNVLQSTSSGNTQRLMWDGGMCLDCPPQLRAAAVNPEPAGAWGGAPLLPASALRGFEGGNMMNRAWGFDEPSTSSQNFAPEPSNAVGGLSSLLDDEPMADENVNPLFQANMFGGLRPILGRKDDSPQPFKHLRF